MFEGSTRKTTFEHDVEERVAKVTYPSGQEASLAYDDLGNRTSFIDQNENTTKFDYNVENRLISITDASGATTRYGYDNLGSLSVTYPNGETIYYEYDSGTRSLRIRKGINPGLNESSAGNEKGDLG